MLQIHPWSDPPSPDAKIIPLRPEETVDGLAALLGDMERVRRALTDRQRRTGWRAVWSPREMTRGRRSRRRPWGSTGRPPLETALPDAAVFVILAGPYPRWPAC